MDKPPQIEQDTANFSAFSADDVPSRAPSLPSLDGDKANQPTKTTGQKIQKWSTYFGVDWFFNAACGVGFAYWGSFTKSGQKYWSGPLDKGFRKILSPLIKDADKLNHSVGRGSMFMSIIAGGMFTIPPLMFLEKTSNRIGVSRFWDRLVHGKDAVENDPKFTQAYDAMEKEPKKEFWPGLISRYVALAPLLLMVLNPKSNEVSTKLWFRHVERGSEWVASKLGFSAKNFKPSTVLDKGKMIPASPEKQWRWVHESMAMDFGLGMPYAVLHSIFYTMFARKSADHKAQRDDHHRPVSNPPVPPITPTTTSDTQTITPDTSSPTTTDTPTVKTTPSTRIQHATHEAMAMPEAARAASPA